MAGNREIFLLNHQLYMDCFFAADQNFGPLGETLRTGRNSAGKTQVSLIPFLLLIQRQALAAFDTLSSDLCYQAWVLFRPGLESTLIIGKWLDNPENASIWSNRTSRRKEYEKAYSGKCLRSESIPNSPQLQEVLKRINDEFVHANPDYYSRHLRRSDSVDHIDFYLGYFDEDDVQEAHAISLLSNLFHLQAGLASAFSDHFNMTLNLPVPPSLFEDKVRQKREELLQNEATRWILQDLGMWSKNTVG